MNKFLYLVWKDPQTRRNFIVGKLTKGKKYTFEYFGDVGKAESHAWSKLEAFPEEEKLYENDVMFPVFSSRLPDKKRKDIDKILEKYGLSDFDEFELLRKSEGRLPIDTYSFIDPIFPDAEEIQRDFYIMGTRHTALCKGEDCLLLPTIKIDDEVFFEREPDNSYDENAIKILTKNREFLGYVPAYYNQSILKRLDSGITYICKIIDLTMQQNCSECIKVRLTMPRH